MLKFRTINQCYNMIKELDTESAITKYFIRTLVESELIKFIKCGTKTLIDFSSLENYLSELKG